MVLGKPSDRVAELVSEPGLLRDLGKNFRCLLFGVARPHQIEDAKLHHPLLRRCLSATVAAIARGRQAPRFSRAADKKLVASPAPGWAAVPPYFAAGV